MHLLLVTTLLLHLLPLNTETATIPENQGKMHLCGDYLARMLSELCHGRYNGPQGTSSGKHKQKTLSKVVITSNITCCCREPSRWRRATSLWNCARMLPATMLSCRATDLLCMSTWNLISCNSVWLFIKFLQNLPLPYISRATTTSSPLQNFLWYGNSYACLAVFLHSLYR